MQYLDGYKLASQYISIISLVSKVLNNISNSVEPNIMTTISLPSDCESIEDLGKFMELKEKSIKSFYYARSKNPPPEKYLYSLTMHNYLTHLLTVSIHDCELSSVQFKKLFCILKFSKSVKKFSYLTTYNVNRPDHINETFFPVVFKCLKERSKYKPLSMLTFYCVENNYIKNMNIDKVFYICSLISSVVERLQLLIQERSTNDYRTSKVFVTAQNRFKLNRKICLGSLEKTILKFWKKSIEGYNITSF